LRQALVSSLSALGFVLSATFITSSAQLRAAEAGDGEVGGRGAEGAEAGSSTKAVGRELSRESSRSSDATFPAQKKHMRKGLGTVVRQLMRQRNL